MIDWKQKLKNQWVQIEISRVQPGKPGNFLPLGPFPFQYSSGYYGILSKNTRGGLCRQKRDIPTDCQYSLEGLVCWRVWQCPCA